VFLHPVAHAGHVAHSSASGPQNINALFSWSGGFGMGSTKSESGHVMLKLCFCIQWDLQVT
jgi:hypothetical protein